MEIWDLYDVNRLPTGKTIEADSKLDKGYYRMVVHLCIFNEKGKMLIQLRQKTKNKWPMYWDLSVGGRSQTGETSRQAIERECLEELGFQLALQETRPAFTINFDEGFDDIYIVERNIDFLKDLSLQQEEVRAVMWASKQEIYQMIDQGKFIPYHKSFIDLIFDLKETNKIFRLRDEIGGPSPNLS